MMSRLFTLAFPVSSVLASPVARVLLPEGVGGKLLRAYDKRTGAVVAEVELPGGTSAAPITYMRTGGSTSL